MNFSIPSDPDNKCIFKYYKNEILKCFADVINEHNRKILGLEEKTGMNFIAEFLFKDAIRMAILTAEDVIKTRSYLVKDKIHEEYFKQQIEEYEIAVNQLKDILHEK